GPFDHRADVARALAAEGAGGDAAAAEPAAAPAARRGEPAPAAGGHPRTATASAVTRALRFGHETDSPSGGDVRAACRGPRLPRRAARPHRRGRPCRTPARSTAKRGSPSVLP